MVRLARPPRNWSDDDDDEFPDIGTLARSKKSQAQRKGATARLVTKEETKEEEPPKPTTTVRRRKLGPLSDNLLLRAWTPESAGRERQSGREKENIEPRRTRVEVRTQKARPPVASPSPDDQEEDYVSAKEEVTIIEEVSVADDTFHSCASDGLEGSEDLEESDDSEDSDESEFEGTESQGSDDDDDDDFIVDSPPARPPAKTRRLVRGLRSSGPDSEDTARQNRPAVEREKGDVSQRASRTAAPEIWVPSSRPDTIQKGQKKGKTTDKQLADRLSRLHLDETETTPEAKPSRSTDRAVTPPLTPPKPSAGLVSPTKLNRIPMTPHRPSSDIFWSQEFVDDWNDEHSPRKQLFPDTTAAKQKSPTKKPQTQTKPQKAAQSERAAKKAFNEAKHEIAENFLHELDKVITNGELSKLAASAGGIKINWSNKLKTTAGRANWKKTTTTTTTTSTRTPDGTTAPAPTKTTHHHASIELAEKVIDDEHRLLNVLAHEFCHLANFMISGVTTNPHGAEFKAWGSKCSRAFAHRGVQVTTKHTYAINFKFVWECVACGLQYGRHSKSIDTARHRCGTCQSELRQTKPVPRGKKGEEKGEGKGVEVPKKKVTGYQAFVKEQMRLVKMENPGSPQKEIMKVVASRWAEAKAATPVAEKEDIQEVGKDEWTLSVRTVAPERE